MKIIKTSKKFCKILHNYKFAKDEFTEMMMVHVSEELRLECQCDKFPTLWLPRVMEHAFNTTHKINQVTEIVQRLMMIWAVEVNIMSSSLYSAESQTNVGGFTVNNNICLLQITLSNLSSQILSSILFWNSKNFFTI